MAEVFLILRKVFYHVIRTRPGVLITGGHKCGYNHRWNNARPNLERVCYESTLSSSRGPSGADRERLLEQQRVSYSTSRFKPDHLLDRHCLSLLNELQLLSVFQLLTFVFIMTSSHQKLFTYGIMKLMEQTHHLILN